MDWRLELLILIVTSYCSFTTLVHWSNMDLQGIDYGH